MKKNQDIINTNIYVTLVGVERGIVRENLKVGLLVGLGKDPENFYDDETIRVLPYNERDDDERNWLNEYAANNIYVANSVRTVARGTYSAGHIYDMIRYGAVAKIRFVMGDMAIAEIVHFGYPIGRRALTEEEIKEREAEEDF